MLKKLLKKIINNKMKAHFKITFLFLFIIVNISLCQNNKLNIYLVPENIKPEDTLNSITCSLANISQDTLITVIEPFDINIVDLGSWGIFQSLHTKFQVPIISIIICDTLANYQCFLGYTPVNFSNFPYVILINPQQTIKITVPLNAEQKEKLKSKKWELFPSIRYREKYIADSVISTFDKEIQKIYALSLTTRNEYTIENIYNYNENYAKKTDSFNSVILEFLKCINKDAEFKKKMYINE